MLGKALMKWVARIVKWLWVTCCVGVLLLTLSSQYDHPGDAGVFFAYAMGILTFPSCLAIFIVQGGILWLLGEFAGYYLPNSRVVMVLHWLPLFGLGYWQWFKFLPWLLRREPVQPLSLK